MPRLPFLAVPAAVAAVVCAAPAFAQTLTIGDAPPPLAVKEFVKGAPVTGFDKDKTYVVEFWATWCGPCKVSIPHLTELQKKNPDVKFVGVSVWEEDQAKVKPFVAEMGEKMGYTVAMDTVPAGADGNAGTMAKTWMAAAGENGIPTAFVIKGGKVAWIGHPMAMDKALADIQSGKYDIAAAAAERKTEKAAEMKRAALMADINKKARAGDFKGAVASVDAAVAGDKSLEKGLGTVKFALLRASGDSAAAANFLVELTGGVYKDEPGALNQLAWGLVDPAARVKATPELVKAALAAAERADEAAGKKDPAIADTLARAYFASGDVKKAVETQERAIKLAAGTPMEKELTAALEEYKKAASGTVAAGG
jgi:thiol-disulfide isomerase/thioredoxin